MFFLIIIYHLLTGLPTRLKVPLQMRGPGNNIQSILKQSTAASTDNVDREIFVESPTTKSQTLIDLNLSFLFRSLSLSLLLSLPPCLFVSHACMIIVLKGILLTLGKSKVSSIKYRPPLHILQYRPIISCRYPVNAG